MKRALAALGRLGMLTLAVGLPIGCSDNAERRALERLLVERAGHLSEVERARIARGAQRAERRFGIEALMLLAVAEEESRFRPTARSHRGALGLMQIRPVTAHAVATRHGIEWRGTEQLFDPETSLLIGAAYLAELRQRFDSWDAALTAYHQGPTRTRRRIARGGNPSAGYAARVRRRYHGLRDLLQR